MEQAETCHKGGFNRTRMYLNMNLEGLQQVLDLNLMGTIIPTKIFGSVIAKQGGGSIVNISSV